MKTYVVELKYTGHHTIMVQAESLEQAVEKANADPTDDGHGEWETEAAYEYAPPRVRKQKPTLDEWMKWAGVKNGT